MKKMLQKSLIGIIIVAMFGSLIVNYYVQVGLAQGYMETTSQRAFRQIDQILRENASELNEVSEEFKEECLAYARVAADTLERRPGLYENQAEMEEMAALLHVDELHVFDRWGTLFAGSEPEYFGLTMYDGEQIQFFLPMLQDKTMELCQDVLPNTADGKMMQYAAVWQPNGRYIVQIGMEPARVLRVSRKNEMSYVFSLMSDDPGSTLYAIDPMTYEILGSNDKSMVGKRLEELGMDINNLNIGGSGFEAEVSGEERFCVFTRTDQYILGRSRVTADMYSNVRENTLFLAFYLFCLAVLCIYFISRYLERNIVQGISDVNAKLQKITDGDLEERVDVTTTPEFAELSGHVNQMVHSLLDASNQLSMVLAVAQTPIGIYEYDKEMKQAQLTGRVTDILDLSLKEGKLVQEDLTQFEARMAELREHPLEGNRGVYRLPGSVERYIKLENVERESCRYGILMDVTREIVERRRIEQERDEDILTGLHSRRGFYIQMDELFGYPKKLGHAVLIMADADNLKKVNDGYGHENGDLYLKGIADVLRSCTAPHQVLSRLGGDEFVLVIYGCETRDELLGYIREIRQMREGHSVCSTTQTWIPISFSMGCSFFPDDGADYHALLKRADELMYQEKRRRKGLAD